MAIIKIDYGELNIAMTSTVLWTNSSPTSTMTSGTTISLSESIDNFNYIGIEYKRYMSDSSTSQIIVTPEDLKKSVSSSDVTKVALGAYYNSARYDRAINYDNNTQLSVTSSQSVGSSTTQNGSNLPIKVIGYK